MNTILLYLFIAIEATAVAYFGVALARFAFAKHQVNKQYIYVNTHSDIPLK
ncbi:MAG: hypothetical protein ACFB15_03155 [Cyclobacteriaceae bacterium]|mgnify:CR=1 FL=1